MIKAFLYAVTFFVAIAFIVAFAVAEPVEEMEPPLSKPESVFTYEACSTLDAFITVIKKYGGVIVSTGEIPNRIISVIVFPDTSFGVFTYDPISGIICKISIGWFTQQGTNA